MVMHNYPIPQPDRRSIQNEPNPNYNSNVNPIIVDYPKQYNQYTTNNTLFGNYSSDLIHKNNQISLNPEYAEREGDADADAEAKDFELQNTMTVIKIKQVKDMRQKLLSLRLLNDKSHYLSSDLPHSSSQITKCNIMLFGPSGSGKSSFIKSLYQSLYNNPILPPDPMKKLIIKSNNENEGTLCFTRLHLKEENNDSSGIILCDTRGHILHNDKEREQFKVMISGNVKEDIIIEQRLKRNSLALWEFWKSSNELFPKEIFKAERSGIESIPHVIVLVFDGSCDKMIREEECKFYKEIVAISQRKGYNDIHVLLTRVDVFMRLAKEQVKNMGLGPTERATRMNVLKEEKIENVMEVLGVSRSNIHFIENYHEDYDYGNDDQERERRPLKTLENDLYIDYQMLLTLGKMVNSCELFLLHHIQKSEQCLDCC